MSGSIAQLYISMINQSPPGISSAVNGLEAAALQSGSNEVNNSEPIKLITGVWD